MRFLIKKPYIQAYRAERRQQLLFSTGSRIVDVGDWVILGERGPHEVIKHEAFCKLYAAEDGNDEARLMLKGVEKCRHGIDMNNPDIMCKKCSNS